MGSTAQELINGFEEDQKLVVFSALADYLHYAIFTDVTLLCAGHQQLKAHKIVLASSSKFFRDFFRTNPNAAEVHLEKELAQNYLSLPFEDVQLIIGILYCVGTVEISPQRIQSLLIASQILGIPTLIRFLRNIKESQSHLIHSSQPACASVENQEKISGKFHNTIGADLNCSSQSEETAKITKSKINHPFQEEHPSRSHSRATLASLESFSLNQLASPLPRDTGDAANRHNVNPSRNVNSVLESFDPSFLNHLPANQIDDLENALLPHLHTQEQIQSSSGSSSEQQQVLVKAELQKRGNERLQPKELEQGAGSPNSEQTLVEIDEVIDQDEEDRSDFADVDFAGADPYSIETKVGAEEARKELSGFNKLLPCGGVESVNVAAIPVILRPNSSPVPIRQKSLECYIAENAKNREQQSETSSTNSTMVENTNASSNTNVKLISLASPTLTEDENVSEEVRLNLTQVEGCKSLKFAIPGSSKSVTLNFSADALMEMRNSVKKVEKETSDSPAASTHDTFPSSMTSTKKRAISKRAKSKNRTSKKEGKISCSVCSKSLTKSQFDKHMVFHNFRKNESCKICGKVFYKTWNLTEHMALVHSEENKIWTCKECDKEFKWERNLLAHHQLFHSEKRFRCKFCPLTFLKRKCYVNHQNTKHAERPETFCKICLEIFDGGKRKQDHECAMIENTGNSFKCHRHDPPLMFVKEKEIEEHLKTHFLESDTLIPLKLVCSVCHKRFMLRKNLNAHLRHFHENEGRKCDFKCKICGKAFFFAGDCTEHENTHKEEKNFQCQCGKEYFSKKALLKHQKSSHFQKENFECSICQKILSDKYKLKYHMSCVHSDKRNFKCSTCQTRFKARENLIKHIKRAHSTALQEEV